MNLAWPPINRAHAWIMVLMAVAGPFWAWSAPYWPKTWPPLYLAGRDLAVIGLLILRWRKALDTRFLVWILPLVAWLLGAALHGTGNLAALLAGFRQWVLPFGMIALGIAWSNPTETNTTKSGQNAHNQGIPQRLAWFLLAGTILAYLGTITGSLNGLRTYFEAKQMPYIDGVPQQWVEPVAGGLYRAAGWWLDPVSNGHVWVWTLALLVSVSHRQSLVLVASAIALFLTMSKGAWLQALMVALMMGALELCKLPLVSKKPAWLRRFFYVLILGGPLLLPVPVRWMADLHPGIAIHWHGWSSAVRDLSWTGDGLGSHGNVAILMHSMNHPSTHATTIFDSAWGSLLGQTGTVGLLLWLGTWIRLGYAVGKTYPLLGLLAYVQVVISMFSENALNPMAMFPLCLSLGSAWKSGSSKQNTSPPRSTLLDYVGRKAGMDYFSKRLHQSLKKRGINNTLYSNFTCPDEPQIIEAFEFSDQPKSRFKALASYLTGMIRVFFGMIQNRSQHFFFHFFKAGMREFLVLLIARLLGQKIHLLVHDVQSLDVQDNNTKARWLRHTILKRLSHRVYTFSRTAAEEVLHEYPGIKDRLTVLSHGHFLDLPAPNPSPEEARALQGLKDNHFYLLFFGQIKESKGLDLLLEAMNLVHDPDIHLVIAGSARDLDPGDLIQWLVEPSVQNQIHLHNRYISDQERDLWFKACDAVVLPYRRIYNSGVLMMALSYGKTVLASDLPANREIIQNGVNGCLFENENAHDLAQNILHLKNTANRPTFDDILTQLNNQHSWDLMANRIEPFLRP